MRDNEHFVNEAYLRLPFIQGGTRCHEIMMISMYYCFNKAGVTQLACKQCLAKCPTTARFAILNLRASNVILLFISSFYRSQSISSLGPIMLLNHSPIHGDRLQNSLRPLLYQFRIHPHCTILRLSITPHKCLPSSLYTLFSIQRHDHSA